MGAEKLVFGAVLSGSTQSERMEAKLMRENRSVVERQAENTICKLAAGYREMLGQLYEPLMRATMKVEDLHRRSGGMLRRSEEASIVLAQFKSTALVAFVLFRAWKQLAKKSLNARFAVENLCPYKIYAHLKLDERVFRCWRWMESQERVIGELPFLSSTAAGFHSLFSRLPGLFLTALAPIQGVSLNALKERCKEGGKGALHGARWREIELTSWALWVSWLAARTASALLDECKSLRKPDLVIKAKVNDPEALAHEFLAVHLLLAGMHQVKPQSKKAAPAAEPPPRKRALATA